MKERVLGFLAAAAVLGTPLTASAAPISVTLNAVTVGSTVFDVTFFQEDFVTTFNQVFGPGCPVLTFTTSADALSAAAAVLAAGDAVNFDYTPAAGRSNSFIIPFACTATDFSWVHGVSDDPVVGVFGPITSLRNSFTRNESSFAVFTPTNAAAVPEPATLSLLALGLLGSAYRARKNRKGA